MFFFLIIYLLEQVVSSMDEKKKHIKTEDLVISWVKCSQDYYNIHHYF